MRERRRISIEGVVQGVGFRPFVYRLARDLGLAGSVRNEAGSVTVDVEGDPAQLDAFQRGLRSRAPPLARVDGVRVDIGPPRGRSDFHIRESRDSDERAAVVPPDTAPCDACLDELRDPNDRRHRYPFLSCTRCGPRFTIVRGLPYDRARTTMSRFPMCEACRAEYDDPGDRRFHAQPTACPACGPELALATRSGEALAEGDEIGAAARALRSGRLLAVKGRGGYHLACDAADGAAVRRLRGRKHREAKPLAVMVPTLAAAREVARIGPEEEELLTSARRPIVLVRTADDAPVAPEVAPRNPTLGVMLPYTPLHHLLLEAVGRPLVMTSGNRSGEPIAYRDPEARGRLEGIADLFLTHDRPIETRCDDSVVRVLRGGPVPIRRSRGYVPEPVPLPVGSERTVLAVGGHLKNTFCLTRRDRAVPSHHVGDLEDVDAYRALQEGIRHFRRLYDREPSVVAHDLHPDYLSTKLAGELREELSGGAAGEGRDVEAVGVQHHHAHVAACLAEHGHAGPAVGIAFDGTGYGPDGTIWGGEVLVADLEGFERVAHLKPAPLPGGDAAVREPWRSAWGRLYAATGRDPAEAAPGLAGRLEPARREGVLRMLERDVASPRSSSVGRLFDAVAALAGLRTEVSFQAQAAMELEGAADPDERGRYPVRWEESARGGPRLWDPAPLLEGVLSDLRAGEEAGVVSARFHETVVRAVVEACERVREDRGLERVALTGGVFQNARLTERAAADLASRGFDPLLHRKVPPNDGGLAYGQAAVALARLAEGSAGVASSVESTNAVEEQAPCV